MDHLPVRSITAMQDYIETHLHEPITLHQLAKVSGYSPYHAAHLFKQALGISPLTYWRKCRLSAAALELRDAQDPILSIALEYQFDSHEGFTRAFASQFGMSPSTYRKLSPPIPIFRPFRYGPTRPQGVAPVTKTTPLFIQLIERPARACIVRRGINGKVEYFAAFIVVLMAAATYMSGIGGGTAMVLASLAFAAVGAIPELIAAMCLAAAVSFTTSPASLETGVISKLTGLPVADYVAAMRPYWIVFVIIAVVVGFWGAKKRKALFTSEESEDIKKKTTAELWKNTVPAIFLLLAVLVGPYINKAVGMPILGPLMYMFITVGLIALCTDFSLKQSADALIDGSTYILTRLFQVGIFLAFINIIGETGAFSAIVSVAQGAPEMLVVPVAVLAGFAIGVPAGAYVGTILTLVLPVAISLGLPLVSIGFIAMASVWVHR